MLGLRPGDDQADVDRPERPEAQRREPLLAAPPRILDERADRRCPFDQNVPRTSSLRPKFTLLACFSVDGPLTAGGGADRFTRAPRYGAPEVEGLSGRQALRRRSIGSTGRRSYRARCFFVILDARGHGLGLVLPRVGESRSATASRPGSPLAARGASRVAGPDHANPRRRRPDGARS